MDLASQTDQGSEKNLDDHGQADGEDEGLSVVVDTQRLATESSQDSRLGENACELNENRTQPEDIVEETVVCDTSTPTVNEPNNDDSKKINEPVIENPREEEMTTESSSVSLSPVTSSQPSTTATTTGAPTTTEASPEMSIGKLTDDLKEVHIDVDGGKSTEAVPPHQADNNNCEHVQCDENPASDGNQNADETTKSASEETPKATLDLDEDKKNPQYIPKNGKFYEHDDRLSGDATNVDPENADKTTEEDKQKDIKEVKTVSTERQRNQRRPNNRRNNRADGDRWTHDRFKDDKQKPKSKEEIARTYGSDIRTKAQEKTDTGEESKLSNDVATSGPKSVDSPKRNHTSVRNDNRGPHRGPQREYRPNNDRKPTDRSDKPTMRRFDRPGQQGQQDRRDRQRNQRSDDQKSGPRSVSSDKTNDNKQQQQQQPSFNESKPKGSTDTQSGSLRRDRRMPDRGQEKLGHSSQVQQSERQFPKQNLVKDGSVNKSSNMDRSQRHDNRTKTYAPRDRAVSREKAVTSTGDKGQPAPENLVDGSKNSTRVDTRTSNVTENANAMSQPRLPRGSQGSSKHQLGTNSIKPSFTDSNRDREKSGQTMPSKSVGAHHEHQVFSGRKNYDTGSAGAHPRAYHDYNKPQLSYQGDQNFQRNNNKSYQNHQAPSHPSSSYGHFDEPIKTQTFENSRLAGSNNSSITTNNSCRSNVGDAREIINEKRALQRHHQQPIVLRQNLAQNYPQNMSIGTAGGNQLDEGDKSFSNHVSATNLSSRPITKSSQDVYTPEYYARRAMTAPNNVASASGSSVTDGSGVGNDSPHSNNTNNSGGKNTTNTNNTLNKSGGNVHSPNLMSGPIETQQHHRQQAGHSDGLNLDSHSTYVHSDTATSLSTSASKSGHLSQGSGQKSNLNSSEVPHHQHQMLRNDQMRQSGHSNQPDHSSNDGQHHHQHHHHQIQHHSHGNPPLSNANSMVTSQHHTHHRGMVMAPASAQALGAAGTNGIGPYYGTAATGTRDSVVAAAAAANSWYSMQPVPVHTSRYMAPAASISNHAYMTGQADHTAAVAGHALHQGAIYPNDAGFLAATAAALSPSALPVTGAGPPPTMLAGHAPPSSFMQHHQFQQPQPSAYTNHYQAANPQGGPPAPPNHAPYQTTGFAIPSGQHHVAPPMSDTGGDIYRQLPSMTYYEPHSPRSMPSRRLKAPLPIVNPYPDPTTDPSAQYAFNGE